MKKVWTLLTTVLLVILLGAAAQADVLLPPGLTEIEDSAFEFNITLSGHLEIPAGVTRIGDYAFGYCMELTSVTIPDTVTEIGDYAFYGCTGLTSLTLPDSVTEIGNYAFYGCTGLTSLTLPPTLTSIGDGAFTECSALHVEVSLIDTPDAEKLQWESQQLTVFSYASREDGSLCLEGCYGEGESVTIPARVNGRSVTALGENVFIYHETLKTISLPDTLSVIGRAAFHHCSALTSVTIPIAVKEIDEFTFFECTSLTTLSLPDALTSIGLCAFGSCTALKTVDIPEGVTSIGQFAFSDCTSLESVTLPQGECTLVYGAFQGCKALQRVTLTENTKVDNYALYDTAWMWAQAQAVVDSVTNSGQTDFEKMLALHDWMTQTNQYDLSLTYYSPDTMFLFKTGVCSGYARTFACLLELVNIEVQNISGQGNGDSHEWNLVKLDGEWYHVDCTWDDPLPDGNERHDYCCVPDSVMQEDHIWDASKYPAATGTKYFQGEKVE